MRKPMKHSRWIALLCAAVIAVSSLNPLRADALRSDEIQTDIDALEERNQALQDELAELEGQYDENYEDIEDMVRQKHALDQQVNLLNQQITVNNQQISAYTVQIADRQVELDEAQARLDDLREKNKDRIRAMEESGSLSYWSVLFKSNSFADLLDRLNMIQEIAEADQRRMAELSHASEEVERARDALLAGKEVLEQTKLELQQSEAELSEKRAKSDELLAELIACGEEYRLLIEEGEARVDALMQEIAQMEAERDAALQAEWEAAHPTEPEEPEDPGYEEEEGGYYAPESSGGWVIPCDYVYVSSVFSDGRMHPILGYVRPHNGIDLAAYLGTPVYATRSGTVTTADYQEYGAGNYVSINHGDGFSSIYMHLDSYVVYAGQYVSAGEVIGYVGTSGLSEGPHLHFGISYYGTYVNPADYMNF